MLSAELGEEYGFTDIDGECLISGSWSLGRLDLKHTYHRYINIPTVFIIDLHLTGLIIIQPCNWHNKYIDIL